MTPGITKYLELVKKFVPLRDAEASSGVESKELEEIMSDMDSLWYAFTEDEKLEAVKLLVQMEIKDG